MVGAINAPGPTSPQIDFDVFKFAALGASTIVQPTTALSGIGIIASAAPATIEFISSPSAAASTSAPPYRPVFTLGASSARLSSTSPSPTAPAPTPSDTSSSTPSAASEGPPASTSSGFTSLITTTVVPSPTAKSDAATPGARGGSVRNDCFVWAVGAAIGVALL